MAVLVFLDREPVDRPAQMEVAVRGALPEAGTAQAMAVAASMAVAVVAHCSNPVVVVGEAFVSCGDRAGRSRPQTSAPKMT